MVGNYRYIATDIIMYKYHAIRFNKSFIETFSFRNHFAIHLYKQQFIIMFDDVANSENSRYFIEDRSCKSVNDLYYVQVQILSKDSITIVVKS